MQTIRQQDAAAAGHRETVSAGLFEGRTRRLKWASAAWTRSPRPPHAAAAGRRTDNSDGDGDGAVGGLLEHALPEAAAPDHPLRQAFEHTRTTGEPCACPCPDAEHDWLLGPVPNGEGGFDVLVQQVARGVPPGDEATPRIEQGKAERALRERVRQQRAVAELGQTALTEHDPQELFDHCAQAVAQVLDIEFTKVLELLPGGHELLLLAGVGWKPGLVGKGTMISDRDSQAGFTLATNEPVVVEDLGAETRFHAPSLLVDHGVVSGMSCIIIGPDDRPWGVLGAHSQKRRVFTDDDVAFLRTAANILGGAVQRAAVEQALRDSELRNRAMLESALDCVISMDHLGRIVDFNPAAERTFGLSREEAVGKVLADTIIPPRFREAHLRGIARYLRTGQGKVLGRRIEMPALRADGSEFPAELAIAVVRVPRHRPLFTAYLRDISEQKAAEQALRASEQHLSQLIQAMPAAVYVCDTEGRVTLFNHAAAELWGREPALDRDLWTGSLKMYRLDGTELPLDQCPMAVALREGRPVFGEQIIVERPDGQRRHVLSHPQPMFDAEGRLTGAINMVVDVTEQKRAEQALRESERRYAMLLSNLPGMAYRCPLQAPWPMEFVSEGVAGLTGYKAEDFMQGRRVWTDVMFAEDIPAIEREIEQSLSDWRPFELAYRVRHADGSIRWVLDRGRYVLDDAGRAVAIEGFISDLTAQVRAQQALAESEEQLRFTLEAARVGTWDWDIARDRVRWSDNLEQIHQLPAGSFAGTPQAVLDGVHPDDREHVRQAINQAIERDGDYYVEYRLADEGPPHWVEGKGRVTFNDQGQAVRMSGVCMDITQRKRGEHMVRVLANAGNVLAGTLDFEKTLDEIAALAVPTLADWCAVDLLEDKGRMRLVAVRHADPAKVALARRLREKYPPKPGGAGAAEAVRTCKPVLFAEISDEVLQQIAEDDEHLRILRDLNLRSAVVVPLVAQGRTLGALTLVSDHEHRSFSEQDLPFFTEFARQCAQAMDSARLYREAQREIALRKRTEKALRDSERLYRAIGESIDYGIWVCDAEGRNIYASESFLKLVGLTQQQCSDFGWSRVLHPDDAAHAVEAWKKCAREQGTWNIEHRFKGVDGKYHPVLARGVPVRDDDGRIICWAGINLDISDVKHAEYQARLHAKMLHRTVQANTELAGELDRQSLLQAVTDAATELTGAQFGAFFHTLTDEKGERFMLYTLSGVAADRFERFPQPRNTEIFAPTFRGDGPIRLDDVTKDPRFGRSAPHHGLPEGHLPVRSYLAVPVKLRNGEVLGGLFLGHEQPGVFTEQAEQVVAGIAAQAAVALDNARLYGEAQNEIAERRRAERALRSVNLKLRQKNEEMTQFVYTVSHDLKSPLVTTIGFVGMLKEDLANRRLENVGDSIGHIERAASHMSDLIDDLLQLSRIGRVELRVETVDTAELVAEVERSFSLRLKNAGAALQVHAPLPQVSADRVRLKQVLENLLSNAVKYAINPDLRIEIGGRLTDKEVRLYVRDNGPGIDPLYHERVFGLFERLDRRHEGTGVGLAIVRRILQLHGGRAWVESDVGGGATFWIALPRDEESA